MEKLSVALDALEEILGCFPDDFFTQLCYGDIRGMRIYLCGDISSGHSDMINEPSGFVNIINSQVFPQAHPERPTAFPYISGLRYQRELITTISINSRIRISRISVQAL